MGFFLFTTASRPALVSTQYPREIFPPGIKRRGREANHSPPSTAEVKNEWSYTYSHFIHLIGVVPN
jgi:hypothetical protein